MIIVLWYNKAVGTGAAWAARAAPLFAADFKNLFGSSYMTCTMPVDECITTKSARFDYFTERFRERTI